MGGKKNGKKKKKEQEEKDVLTEVDKEYYEIQLADLNRKLSRMKTRASELETQNTQLQDNMKKMEEDRSDVIAYLKKTLKAKTNELLELQERFDGLKQSMETGVVEYKEKIAQMEQDYKNMQDQLTSDIKLLMGKLNSLEEFRTQKEELMAKFQVQEEKMAEQENVHKENLYKHEKNFILEKNKLKKEMETQLLQLSLNFKEATDIRIAAYTQKMIRENIAINNELTLMQDTQREMMDSYEDMRSKLQKARLNARISHSEKMDALKKNQTLVKVIDELVTRQEETQEKIKELNKAAAERDELNTKLLNCEKSLENAKQEISKLKERVAAGQSNSAKLYADIAALKLNSRRLYGTLHKAVNAVKEAVKIHEEPKESEEVVLSKRHHLLHNLLQILNKAEMSEKERFISRKTSLSYKKGDLGFIPKTDKKLSAKESIDET